MWAKSKINLKRHLSKTCSRAAIPYWATLVVFLVALIARLPYMSHGMDQWDVVLYKDSLVHMQFLRPAQWPLLLLMQKGLWLMLPNFSAQQILSLTNIILSAGTLAIFFALVRRLTYSYIAASVAAVVLYFMPLFGVYSVVGMQDMAQTFGVTLLVATILKFLWTKRLTWLYISSFTSGFVLGIRLTLILALPALTLCFILTRGLSYKNYLKGVAAWTGGAIVGLVASLFITALYNTHDTTQFFIRQYRMFNPHVLGYFQKGGDYALLSGYRRSLFYWLPLLWLEIYVVARLRQKKPSLQPVIALGGALISLFTAYGLNVITKEAPSPKLLVTLAIVLGLLLVYELLRFSLKLRTYARDLTENEKTSLVLAVLILTFLIFNYVATGGVARYLLPVIPAILLLMLTLVNQRRWRSWGLVGVWLVLGYWGCSFSQSQSIVGAFRQLDPRSAVVGYVNTHPGKYYTFDSNVDTYAQSLGGVGYLQPPFNPGCAGLEPAATNYAIFYGPAPVPLVQSCSHYSFKPVASFKRTESVIEDSVGNLGYTIYQLSPQP